MRRRRTKVRSGLICQRPVKNRVIYFIQNSNIFWPYAMLHYSKNALTGSGAFIGRRTLAHLKVRRICRKAGRLLVLRRAALLQQRTTYAVFGRGYFLPIIARNSS